MKSRNGQRRAGMWIAGLSVVAVIAATYLLTRPPELVWWTSPIVGNTGRRVHVRVPASWRLEPPEPVHNSGSQWTDYFSFNPGTGQPRWMQWVFRRAEEKGDLFIGVGPLRYGPGYEPVYGPTLVSPHKPGRDYQAYRYINYPECGVDAVILYRRTYSADFTATYEGVCASLRFE